MANTYTWKIESLDCVPSVDGQSNVVSNVHWRAYVTDEIHTVCVYGVQPLVYNAEMPFTTYENLTENVVIEWAKTAMGDIQIASITDNLDNQIANLINPSVITPLLPW
jgi:hypothetical protein